MKKYQIIYADPPWKYGAWGKGSGTAFAKVRPMPYETMTVEEIASLSLEGLADNNCDLYLWTTQRYLPDSLELFARRKRLGWDCWGNEVESDIEL